MTPGEDAHHASGCKDASRETAQWYVAFKGSLFKKLGGRPAVLGFDLGIGLKAESLLPDAVSIEKRRITYGQDRPICSQLRLFCSLTDCFYGAKWPISIALAVWSNRKKGAFACKLYRRRNG
ncbi:MAG: hypothetical protein LBU32_09575 [Clostridiales bacterium]|nr:hypothetical protein [Clostridiales bacterium]